MFGSSTIVRVHKAQIVQDGEAILKDINFELEKGEFCYLIGRTGSGKSSLLKTMYADLPISQGEMKVANFDIQKINRSKIPLLRRKIGIIFQDFQLLNDRSVYDNLLFVLKATGWSDANKIKIRISEVLLKVGLSALANKFPHQISGGEQQRIVVARALLNEPLILFADEPTGNLDPEVSEDIMKIFFEINKSGTAILMATHNHQLIEKYPARILKVENGKVLDSAKGEIAKNI
ncbi:MAG: ATP-binding cassette domain-containing protein [Cytophagales bacterium]|nr:MAG: ATP-binding cassette domain-containing protein [Cytophagales bacterium]